MFALPLFLPSVAVAAYLPQYSMQGPTFWDHWDFFTAADPTHGYIKYVDQPTCEAAGIINSTATQVFMSPDLRKVQHNSPRDSVRLTSKASFNGGLFILDVAHSPAGCATWPAFWIVGPNWPSGGEIDIIEGVNMQTSVTSTLHTSNGCSQAGVNKTKMTGNPLHPNCYVNAPGQGGNEGCGIQGAEGSYGAGLNSAGGGVFATEWTDDHIQMFFWPRALIPGDIKAGKPVVESWGKPYAYFQLGQDCPATHFSDMQLVFDLVLCGDWAGNVFSCAGKGMQACKDYADYHPEKLSEAYWLVNSVNTYQMGTTDVNATAKH